MNSKALNPGNEVWIDHKGRSILIHTMSDRWLNNIRKYFRGSDRSKIVPIMDEIKRRKKLRRRDHLHKSGNNENKSN